MFLTPPPPSSLTPPPHPGGEALVQPIPPAAVLLDRPVDRPLDGRHPAQGGGDQAGTGSGDLSRGSSAVEHAGEHRVVNTPLSPCCFKEF